MEEQTIKTAKEVLASFFNIPIDEISCTSLLGGSDQASIVKCTHHVTSYVIKFFNSSKLGKNEIAWTKHASDLGIGPKLYYADPTGIYMLIEFVKGNSLVPTTANTPEIIKNIATNIEHLHNSSAPFAHASDMFIRIDAKYKKLNCSAKLKEILENELQYVKKIEVQLQNFEVSLSPCHNDLNPGNIFENNNQVTLIDWGDASLGNPYYDIAAFFVLNIIEPENEKLFFEQYNSKLLTPQLHVYMKLYKQLVYFEFALNLLLGVQIGKAELLHIEHIPQVNNVNYYLTLLAKQEVEIDTTFLYNMAIASLSKIR